MFSAVFAIKTSIFVRFSAEFVIALALTFLSKYQSLLMLLLFAVPESLFHRRRLIVQFWRNIGWLRGKVDWYDDSRIYSSETVVENSLMI